MTRTSTLQEMQRDGVGRHSAELAYRLCPPVFGGVGLFSRVVVVGDRRLVYTTMTSGTRPLYDQTRAELMA